MTYYEGEPYEVTHTSRQWYRCDATDCDKTVTTEGLSNWEVWSSESEYGGVAHYCPEHREVQGE